MDKAPTARESWIFARDEIEALLSDPRLLPDRRVAYGILFLTGCRFGELAALRWRDWNRTLLPLTRLTIARAIKSVSRREASTKTRAVKLVPVHPTLEKILGDWHAAGWELMMGHAPKPDDLVLPSRRGNARGVHNGNRYLHEDCARLGFRPRHQHCARHSMITLAQDDGAEGAVLRWMTHAPPRSAFDSYTRTQWKRLCEEIVKLRIIVPAVREVPVPCASDPTEAEAGSAKKSADTPPAGPVSRVCDPVPRSDCRAAADCRLRDDDTAHPP